MRNAEKAQAAAATNSFDDAAGITACERLNEICRKNRRIPREMLEGLETIALSFTMNKRGYMAVHAFLKGQEEAEGHQENLRLSPSQLNRLAYKAYLLFGNPAQLSLFCNKYNSNFPFPRRTANILSNITFPEPQTWEKIDFRTWGLAYLQHGYEHVNPMFTKYGARISPMKMTESRISIPAALFALSAQEEWEKAQKTPTEKEMDRLQELARLSARFNKTQAEFRRALTYTFSSKNETVMSAFALPDLHIDGKEFGCPGAVFRKMRMDDPRLVYIGDFTGSCERVTDRILSPTGQDISLERVVESSARSSKSAFYIVEKDQDILASSWAWRGMAGAFVLDGFESREKSFNAAQLAKFLSCLPAHINAPSLAALEIDGILVGHCKKHLTPATDHLDAVKYNSVAYINVNREGLPQSVLRILKMPRDATYNNSVIQAKM